MLTADPGEATSHAIPSEVTPVVAVGPDLPGVTQGPKAATRSPPQAASRPKPGFHSTQTYEAAEPAPAPAFVPVVVEPEAPASPTPKKRRKPRTGGDIEIEIDGVVVRIGRGAEAKTVAAVIQALKAGQ